MDKNELPGMYLNHPISNYANWQYDAVCNEGGKTIGLAVYTGFSWNYRSMLSTAVVEPEHAKLGNKMTIVWGEPDGGVKSRPWLEPHRQIRVSATVIKAPKQKGA
jgi:vanillate/3-O-methylgallate O-demethylase